MNFGTLVSVAIMALAFLMAIPVLKPQLDGLQSVVHDCVDTKPPQRT